MMVFTSCSSTDSKDNPLEEDPCAEHRSKESKIRFVSFMSLVMSAFG